MEMKKGTSRACPTLHYGSAKCGALYMWFAFQVRSSGKRLSGNDQSSPVEHSLGVSTSLDHSSRKGLMCFCKKRGNIRNLGGFIDKLGQVMADSKMLCHNAFRIGFVGMR